MIEAEGRSAGLGVASCLARRRRGGGADGEQVTLVELASKR